MKNHKREYGRTGIQVSPLGFGGIYFPLENGRIKEEYTIEMLRHAMDLGVNYFDTAPDYGNAESQVVIGKAIKGRRDHVYISTKNPYKGDDAAEWRQGLEESLTLMDTDYIDFYHVHNLDWAQYVERFSKGPLADVRKAQEEGLIRHFCFSSHDNAHLRNMIDTGEFAGMIVQYNLLDRTNEDVMAHAHEQGMGVVIMGPLCGGRLVASEQIKNLMPTGESKSSAETALRFVLSNPNVTMALSGMSTIAMVDENVATASRTEPLSDDEHRHVLEMLVEYKRLADLYCTGCGYCMPCKNGVSIHENFYFMNQHRIYGTTAWAREQYRLLGERIVDGQPVPAWAASCIECGECEPKCPQKISIREQLKEVHNTLGGRRDDEMESHGETEVSPVRSTSSHRGG
ncbi:MAG: aldo/keto reductase [Deltaproteobacteria bacterium]|nr:aldo/keto reductase [Deltaproteobacteria bacterium]